MKIYVYSDESGVFTKQQEIFVFSGILFLDLQTRDSFARKYLAIEKDVKKNSTELKSSCLKQIDRKKFLKTLNNQFKFSVIINISKVKHEILCLKKARQRFLDWSYKMGLKNILMSLHDQKILNLDDITELSIFCDEHTTATNGYYELRESILSEFQEGSCNYEQNTYFPPILKNLKKIDLKFCDSKKEILIRCSDLIANTVYRYLNSNFKIKDISLLTENEHKKLIIKKRNNENNFKRLNNNHFIIKLPYKY